MSQTVHVVFRCNEGQGENLVAIFGEALIDTRAFDGCESVEVYADAATPAAIVRWEKFATRAHHEAYLAWRIETGMLDMLGPILTSGLEVAYLDDRDA